MLRFAAALATAAAAAAAAAARSAGRRTPPTGQVHRVRSGRLPLEGWSPVGATSSGMPPNGIWTMALPSVLLPLMLSAVRLLLCSTQISPSGSTARNMANLSAGRESSPSAAANCSSQAAPPPRMRSGGQCGNDGAGALCSSCRRSSSRWTSFRAHGGDSENACSARKVLPRRLWYGPSCSAAGASTLRALGPEAMEPSHDAGPTSDV